MVYTNAGVYSYKLTIYVGIALSNQLNAHFSHHDMIDK